MSTEKHRDTTEPRKKSTIVKHWERDIRRGLLQLMILMLIRLRTQDAHGYGLIKLIRETGIGIELKAGTIYPLLKRMENDNLIESELADDIESPGIPRRIYTITMDGEEMIEEMIGTYFSYHDFIKKWYQEIINQKRR
ncbi:MAG: PadR family transcriptional regulator [Candidatus Thorarchaeota archaeon]